MLQLSIHSLKLHNSNVQIAVVMNRESCVTLCEKRLSFTRGIKQTVVKVLQNGRSMNPDI